MNLFAADDYKQYVRLRLRGSQGKGHGQYSRIAEHLGIHTSMVSQVFNGPKHLTFDQACGICAFFGFTELEMDYFVALVQLERAGNNDARKKCERELSQLRARANSLNDRLTKDVVLDDAANAIFYSQWFYTATKLLCSIPGNQSSDVIAKKLDVSLYQINRAIEFLISKGLCVDDNGKVKPGPSNTHLGADSPLVGRHHQNWRVKGFEKMGDLKPSELFLTMPATLRFTDALLLRQKMVEFIDEIVTVIDKSKGEALYCFNIDWFQVEK